MPATIVGAAGLLTSTTSNEFPTPGFGHGWEPPGRYFGQNLSRLSAVRQKVDPGRIMFSGLNY